MLPQIASVATFNELIHKLNELVATEKNEIAVARGLSAIESEARGSLKNEPGYLLSLMGSIYAAKGNTTSMHKSHRNSLAYMNHPVLSLNYARSMMLCGEFKKAYEFMSSAERKYPDNVTMVEYLADLSFELGSEKKYRDHATRYHEMTGVRHKKWNEFEAEMQEISGLNRLCSTSISCAEGV